MLDGPGSKTLTENVQPLFVLNGEIISKTLAGRLKPTYIDSITILKRNAAKQRYGKKGQQGVVQIFANDKIRTDLEPDTTNVLADQ